MQKIIKKIFSNIKKYFGDETDTCRLLEIDVSKQEVKFQIKMKLPILKCSIRQAINELDLVDRLSPIEACYLGGHYGRSVSKNDDESINVDNINKDVSFLLKNKSGRYQILYQDRSGTLGYYDKKFKKEFAEFPLTIANNDSLISCFDSSQACYIGILAGIGLERTIVKDKAKKSNGFYEKKLYLKLVK